MLKRWLLLFILALAPALSFAEEIDDEINDVEALPQNEESYSSPDESSAPVTTDGATRANPRIEAGQPRQEVKDSSAHGEKIFDWDANKGKTEVKHPFSEKGLIRIDRNKIYYYKVKESEDPRAMSLQIGVFDPRNLRNPDAKGDPATATFEANYDQASNPAILITKEWRLFEGALGKLTLRAGTGAFVAQGHGHFHKDNGTPVNSGLTPMETLTFIAMPNSFGVAYRLKFGHRPLFVPYVDGGVIAFTFMELRDDNKGPKFGGSLAGYGAAGLGLNLTWFDYLSRIRLDHEYGINAVYLTAEYRRIQAITTRYDFTSDFINGGLLMEY